VETSSQLTASSATQSGLRCAACQLGLEGIVSKRLGSRYISGRSPDWVKMKNPACAAVKREEEEDWGR
jgi:ATP-dependent DNA ligase